VSQGDFEKSEAEVVVVEVEEKKVKKKKANEPRAHKTIFELQIDKNKHKKRHRDEGPLLPLLALFDAGEWKIGVSRT
jgi:hypothetical protein